MICRSFVISIFVVMLLAPGAVSKEAVTMGSLSIGSTQFQNNSSIPRQYTCDGKDVNPPLDISGVPTGTQSLALIVDDPDAPAGTWVHWVVWNIDPGTKQIAENSVPKAAVQGRNDFRKTSYGGPCPPSGTHRYFFKLYALDTRLGLKTGATKQDVERAMKGHVLGEAHTVGLYKR